MFDLTKTIFMWLKLWIPQKLWLFFPILQHGCRINDQPLIWGFLWPFNLLLSTVIQVQTCETSAWYIFIHYFCLDSLKCTWASDICCDAAYRCKSCSAVQKKRRKKTYSFYCLWPQQPMTKSDKFIAIISHYLLQGTSSVALAWSGTFDDLIGGHISTYFQKNAPMGLTGLAPYPDIFATVLVLLLSGNVEALISSHRVITITTPRSSSSSLSSR